MIGLTAGIGVLASAFGTGFASLLPTLLLLSLGPTLTFGVLHKIWEYMQKCFTWSKTRRDSNEYWDLYPTMRDKFKDGVDDGTEVFWDYKKKISKNGKSYYEVDGDKFFLNDSGWSYVIPRDGIPYSTDSVMNLDSTFDKIQSLKDEVEWDRYDRDGGTVKDYKEAYDLADSVWAGYKKIK